MLPSRMTKVYRLRKNPAAEKAKDTPSRSKKIISANKLSETSMILIYLCFLTLLLTKHQEIYEIQKKQIKIVFHIRI
jgi:hypothetical protein